MTVVSMFLTGQCYQLYVLHVRIIVTSIRNPCEISQGKSGGDFFLSHACSRTLELHRQFPCSRRTPQSLYLLIFHQQRRFGVHQAYSKPENVASPACRFVVGEESCQPPSVHMYI